MRRQKRDSGNPPLGTGNEYLVLLQSQEIQELTIQALVLRQSEWVIHFPDMVHEILPKSNDSGDT